MSLKTKMKQRKPDHVDLVFCMDRPLAKELEASRAADVTATSYAGGKSAKTKELEKAVTDSSVTVRVSSLPRDEYNALILAHPPREGRDDEVFNPETFFDAAAKATAVEVTAKGTVPIPDDDWAEFVSGLTDGEFDRLAGAVLQVNRSQATVQLAPFV